MSVDNTSPPDTTLPTVSISSPTNNATIKAGSRNFPITATAADNVGVARVAIYVNGSLLCSDLSAPYSCSWNVPNGKNKKYSLSAKAFDARGNEGSSAVIQVISN